MNRYAHEVLLGDVVEVLSRVPDSSFDACFCDPPYLLEFMNKQFDRQHKHMPGSYSNDGQRMQAWHERWTREVFRVLKPGGFVLAFGGTRTCHRLASALEDVGFEIRDTIEWIYGSGFPKSSDISKSIDKYQGIERKITGSRKGDIGIQGGNFANRRYKSGQVFIRDAPGSEQSACWSGYQTSLKPAHEPLILAMKPCEGTYAQNALTYNVAGLNIDGCRVATIDNWKVSAKGYTTGIFEGGFKPKDRQSNSIGRYPANFVLSHHPDCVETEVVQDCHPLCPVRLLDEQSGIRQKGHFPKTLNIKRGKIPNLDSEEYVVGNQEERFTGSGGASRFFYISKVSTRERQLGLEHSHSSNNHPTLKPISLCTYLATLLLPPSRPDPSDVRRLLVPFSGTGSEIAGAIRSGWDYILGIEMDPEYVTISQSRIPALISVDK